MRNMVLRVLAGAALIAGLGAAGFVLVPMATAGAGSAGDAADAQSVDAEYAGQVTLGKGIPDDRFLVTAGLDDINVRDLVEQAGGRVLVEMPPDRALVSFPRISDAEMLASDFRIRSIAPLVGDTSAWAVDAADSVSFSGLRLASSARTVEKKDRPLVNDMIGRDRVLTGEIQVRAPVVPPAGIAPMPRPLTASIPVVPAWPMKNVVAVTIVLPESNGSIDTNRENWTTTLEDQVESEITAGMAWWANKADSFGVNLSFKVYIYKPSANPEVKIGYEPISRNSTDEGLWIGAVMSKLGYSDSYYVSAVESFNAYMEDYADADHAVTIFVANSQNDSDDMFPDGYFAYAHWGGPLIVMTTGNGGYGLSMMDTVSTHEMGHSFYAVDEYYSPGYAVCSCNDGYNGCKNRNCDNNCGMDVPCMMKENSNALCADTVCHIGWVCQCSSGICCDGCGYRPGTHACRKANGDCDVTEFCSGSTVTCPADTFKTKTTKCRNVQGTCDVAEYCTGTQAACPTDVVLSASTECRAADGVCDVAEKCTGVGPACPVNAFLDDDHVCRESGGDCDVAENCSGSSANCPADRFKSSITECRESAGDCDAAELCTGKSADCPADKLASSDKECRASTAPCDAAEHCTGSDVECPDDSLAPATTVCRAAAGGCDAPEYCTGSTDECPIDQLQRQDFECRPAAAGCDAPEFCDGVTAKCPPDYIQGKGFVCRPEAGACDAPEKCSGTSIDCPVDYIQNKGYVCRPAQDDCDQAEKCTGTSVHCPEDEFFGAGTTCDDGRRFTENDRCDANGQCVGVPKADIGCSAAGGGFGGQSRSIPGSLILLGLLFAALFMARFSRHIGMSRI